MQVEKKLTAEQQSRSLIVEAVHKVKMRLGFWDSAEKMSQDKRLREIIQMAAKEQDDRIYVVRMCTLGWDDERLEHHSSRVYYKDSFKALRAALQCMLDGFFANTDDKRIAALNSFVNMYFAMEASNPLTAIATLCQILVTYIKKSSRMMGQYAFISTLRLAEDDMQVPEFYLMSTSEAAPMEK